MRWFRRDAARKSGQTTRSRAFTLGGLVVLTTLLAGVSALLALPLRRARDDQMTTAAREEIGRLFAAIESYRADHYRFPDTLDQLAAAGYHAPASLVICRYRHVLDTRNFDDHVEVALHHRGAKTALAGRYPSGGTPTEQSLTSACAGESEE